MKEYVIPTHAPRKEMPAMISMKTSEPLSSAAIFVLYEEKDECRASD